MQITKLSDKDGYYKCTKWEKHGRLGYITYENVSKTPLSNNQLSIPKRRYSPWEEIKMTLDGLNATVYTTSYIGIYWDNGTPCDNWCYVSTGNQLEPTKPPLSHKVISLYANSGTGDRLFEGTYQIRLYANENASSPIATVKFEVKHPIICEARYTNGSIEAAIIGYVGKNSWVGVYTNGTTNYNNTAITWHYVTEEVTYYKTEVNADQTTRFRINANLSNVSGHKVVLFIDGGYTAISESAITQITKHLDPPVDGTNLEDCNLSIITSKPSYRPNEAITVNFSGVTNINAWMGLYHANVPKDQYRSNSLGMWLNVATGKQFGISDPDIMKNTGTRYMSAASLDVDSGLRHIVPAGQYKVVLFNNNGYTESCSYTFTVTA